MNQIIERFLEWVGMIAFASATSLILYLIDVHENKQKASWYGALLKALGGGLSGAFVLLIGTALNWDTIWIAIAAGSVGAVGASFIRDLGNAFATGIKTAIMARGK